MRTGRDDADAGVLGVLLLALRRHVLEATLLVVACGAIFAGLTAFNEPSDSWSRFFWRGTASAHTDATFVSALLEMRDGRWHVRAEDIVRVPTKNVGNIDATHASRRSVLVVPPRLPWTFGAVHRIREVPAWSIESHYRVVSSADGWAVATIWSKVESEGESSGTHPVVLFPGEVVVASGTGPSRDGDAHWTAYAPEGGSLLHLTALMPPDARDPADVETWRELVRSAARARVSGDERESQYWFVPTRTPHLAAIATLLGVDDALDTIGVRPFRSTGEEQVSSQRLSEFARCFVHPSQALRWVRATHTDDADLVAEIDALLASSHQLREMGPLQPSRPATYPFLVPLLVLLAISAFPAGLFTPLRRRDVCALLVAFLLASTDLRVVEHVATSTFGLMATALQLQRLRRRGALRLPPGAPRAFALAALLLPLASMTRLPVIDALARALALGGIGFLALAPIRAHMARGDAPRAAPGRRTTAWMSIQILVVALALLALVAGKLEPWTWMNSAPRPRWAWITGGIALATVAGLIAFLRAGAPRPSPVAACAWAVAMAISLAVVVMSLTFVDQVSGETELSYIAVATTTIALVWAMGRLFRATRLVM